MRPVIAAVLIGLTTNTVALAQYTFDARPVLPLCAVRLGLHHPAATGRAAPAVARTAPAAANGHLLQAMRSEA
jgi:hypothetical protein